MLADVVLGLLSLAVLIAGSEKIVRHAVVLMSDRGISGSFIGLAVISIGTSLPEVLTHVVASADILRGRIDPDVAAATVLGTNVGSDIAQQNLLVGIVALAGLLTFTKTLLYRDFGVMIGVAALVLAFGWNGWLSRLEGAVLVAGYGVYLALVYRSRLRDDIADTSGSSDSGSETGVWRHWIWIVGGLTAIVTAGHFVLQAAERLVGRTGLAGSFIGVAVIGIATSLPELSTALASVRKGQSELSVGTLVGSNITNPMLALGLGMLISGYSVPAVVVELDLPVKIGTAAVIFVFLLSGRRLSRLESVILIGMYVSYLATRMWLYPEDLPRKGDSVETAVTEALSSPDPGDELLIGLAGGPGRMAPAGWETTGGGFPRGLARVIVRIGDSSRDTPGFTWAPLPAMSRDTERPPVTLPPVRVRAVGPSAPRDLVVDGVGTWSWKLEDGAISTSEENFHLFGLDHDEGLGGERWLERVHAQDRERVEQAVREALSGGSSYDIEFRVALPDGRERWLWAKGSIRRDDSDEPVRVAGVNVDITSRKRRELERDDAVVRMRRASDLKDDFLAMLGHELRNPLGAIANGVALLRGDTTQEHRAWAEEMIERQTLQLKRLVDDILEVSRVTRGQLEIRPEVVSLSACIEAARDAVRERLREDHRDIHVSLPEERIHVFVDPTRMQQVLGNLLANAIKYTETGSRVGLSAERRNDRVLIRVEDDGEGLSTEHLEIVFEPFVRVSKSLRRAGSGLGIGLTLVKKLVELHGGTVRAHSDGPDEGCTFTIELPVHDGEPASGSKTPRDELEPLRILVIDDNKDLALGLRKRLESQGHVVTLAHDGPEGIRAAGRTRPHVVLVDIGLPSMDGYEVAEKLRAQASSPLQVAGISGFKERGEENVAEEAFDHYFLKPVDAEQLNAWLTRVATELDGGVDAPSDEDEEPA